MNTKTNCLSIILFLALLLGFLDTYAQIEFNTGTYSTNEKRIGKVEVVYSAEGEISLNRKIKANIGSLVGSVLVGQSIDEDALPGVSEYNLKRTEDNPNHYVAYLTKNNGKEYPIALLRVHEDYALFSRIYKGNILGTHVLAKNKQKVKEIADAQQFESLIGKRYPKDDLYEKNIGKIVFSNSPISSTNNENTPLINTYKMGDPLYFRAHVKEPIVEALIRQCKNDINVGYNNDVHYRNIIYELFFDGKSIGEKGIFNEYNPMHDFIWQECIFTSESCEYSALAAFYSEVLLSQKSDLLTVGEHSVRIEVRGYNGRTKKKTAVAAVGSFQMVITPEGKQKALTNYTTEAGMHNASIENASLEALRDQFPKSNYSKVLIKSRRFSVVRHEITGVVLYRTLEIYGFGKGKKGCFRKIIRVIQDFNGVSYENSFRVDHDFVLLDDFKYMPCESIPK